MAQQKTKRTYKQQAISRFILVAGIIVLVNILSYVGYTRIDLTADKRFTLSDSTTHMLKNLDDEVFVKVYLTGDLPAGFKRLENSTRDLLNEFRSYGKDNIQYQFEDPLLNKSVEERNQIYAEMKQKGLQATNIQTAQGDAYSEKIVIPGAIVSFKGRETPVSLLMDDNGVSSQGKLNNSVSVLENKFSSAIQKLRLQERIHIGILRGNRELPLYTMYDMITSLSEFYQVDTINISSVLNVPQKYKVLIVAKPTIPFLDRDKFKIDQYIMNGGKVLWLLDGMNVSMDSLQAKASHLSMGMPLNIDDQLFTYGCRVSTSLVLDLQCNPVPLLVNYNNNQPEFRLFPFFYFPVLTPSSNNVITKEIKAIQTQFISGMDTVRSPGVKKTVLLTSSEFTREVFSPWPIDLRGMKDKPDTKNFNKKNLITGVLLEGSFKSVFSGRLDPSFEAVLRDSLKMPFVEQSKPSAQIVISDGDIIRNEFSEQGKPYTLGYYKYTGEFFANKNFLLNCIDYLSNQQDRIITRSKEVKLRMLDSQKVKDEKTTWQLVNILLPIVIIIIFGMVYTFIRLRRYAV